MRGETRLDFELPFGASTHDSQQRARWDILVSVCASDQDTEHKVRKDGGVLADEVLLFMQRARVW